MDGEKLDFTFLCVMLTIALCFIIGLVIVFAIDTRCDVCKEIHTRGNIKVVEKVNKKFFICRECHEKSVEKIIETMEE